MKENPYSFVIVSEAGGRAEFKEIIPGVTMIEEVDEATSFSRMKIVPSNDEKLNPALLIKDDAGKTLARYPLPDDALLMVDRDQDIFAGDVLAKIAKDTTRQMDITGGLPRIVEQQEEGGVQPRQPHQKQPGKADQGLKQKPGTMVPGFFMIRSVMKEF